ncbi:MAG: hypothetical protein GQ579_04285, partial [Bacteroidales bacterium]|nr:hypothetical protein [Bacteroidales bacterium]
MLSGGESYHHWSICNYFRLCASVVLFHFLVSLLPAQDTQFTTELFTSEDGLSHNSVLWIEKDAYGFLWINTFSGLNRFDGSHFTIYARRDFEPMELWHRSQLKKDSKGELWLINPIGRGLRYDYHHDSFHKPFNVSYEKEVPFREQDGTLWIYNNTMLFKMGESFDDSAHVVSEFKLGDLNGQNNTMFEFPKGHLWFYTSTGIYYMSEIPDLIELTKYELEIQNLDKQPEKINWIIPDGDKLWIIADYKVIMAEIPLPPDSDDNHLISGEMLVFDRPELELRADHPVYMIASDGDRNLYFRTFYGVYRFNTETRKIDRLYAEDYGQLDWGEGNFQSAMKYDQDGILWVGTDEGLLKITLGNENFHVIKPDPLNPHGLNHPKLNDVLIDRNQNLWVGTVGDGLYRGIPDNFGKYQNFEHYMPDPGDPFSLQSTGICRLLEDSRGDIWFLGETIQRINTLEGAPRFLPTPFPKSGGTIEEDPQGNILVPDIFSLCWVYNPNTGKTYPLYPDKTTTNYKNSQFIVTNDKSCYFMIQNALFQFHGQIKFSEETGEETGKWTDNMTPFAYPERTTLLLDSNAIGQGKILVTEHADYKEFWITRLRDENLSQYQLQERNTINGENDESPGIKMDLVNIYSTRNGLTHGHVFEIIEDDSKRIWCPTQNGLTCIDPATGQVYRYYKKDGLPTNKFYWGYHKDRNGIIYLCTTNGLVYFHPDSIVSNPPPPVFLTGLRLFNRPIGVGNDSPLEKVMMHTDRISLSYNQNFISFEFAALDLRNPAQVRYQYKMEGLDHDWVDAENRRRADYSGMRPGRYTFRVIAANSNGVWNREGASVEIFISRPLWYSWWAFSAYVILLFLILLLIRRFEKKRAKLKTELRIERIDKEKTLELDKMKSRFYTNISHEFRTP